ncbi:hypothetical protein PORY_001032 [Pneumocystis oryctolagi]|uniref:Uncharacterized protein n=1 Tax=Pneumocystis oryctolagi TaxID=42067 RepID=A0ACB7CCJ1_9ASCO|nr:hypothetical protein PORY_001032 [Pneumocystis oryctolagi]
MPFSDPIDWISSELPDFEALEESFRCRICKDLMIAPVITGCCHTFCSLCIRRCLSQEQRCPVCRRPEEEQRLRKNTSLEDAIEAFGRLRPHLLALVNRQKVECSREKTNIQCTTTNTDAKMVECPICIKPVDFKNINEHLDICLDPVNKNGSKSSDLNISKQKSCKYTKLPKPNYALWSESKLRSELKSLGLKITGDKVTLQRRHAEWINLWNANTDAKAPLDKQVLLKRLDTWDQKQSKSFNIKHIVDKDWIKTYETDFEKLIQNAQESSKKRKIEIEHLIDKTSEEPNQ